MALLGIFWPNIAQRDIHLVPGTVSPRIDQLLWIEDSTGDTVASSPPAGVTVTFMPRFFGAPAAHGVTVNTTTGQVEVGALPAVRNLRNFIIDCTATEGATILTRMIRIHIHPAIQRHWVTPSRLRVPLDARNMRFSVLAEFTDGTVGDITNWGPFEQPGGRDETYVQTDPAPRRPVLEWTSRGIGIRANSLTGRLIGGAADAAGVKITATLDASLVDQPAQPGLADGAPAWSTATRVTHIAGPLAQMNDRDVQNFLILPDGFHNDDEQAFKTLADNLVDKLMTKERLTPWSHLHHKMNYFRAWVPSLEKGLTTLNEVHRFNKKAGGDSDAFEFEQPRVPGPGIPALSAMIHAVGLPVPVDDLDGQEYDDKRFRWTVLYGPDAVDHTSVATYTASGNAKLPGWLDLNDRVVLNERATAFHIAMGERPAAELESGSHAIGGHPLRFSVGDFDDFLANLEDRPDNKIGATWTIGQKDHGNVLILCRTLHHGGANSVRVLPANPAEGRLICIAMGSDFRNRITTNPAGDGFDIRPDTIPPTAGVPIWTTAAHELAHSLGLEDEYGDERGGRYPNTEDNRKNVAKAANVQMRHALDKSLDGELIKWRFRRIRKAGLLTVAPAPVADAANRFKLTLRAGQANKFIGVGSTTGFPPDIVRLRKWPLLTAGPASIRFKVTKRTPSTMEIQAVEPLGAFNRATFVPGSLVIAPRRAPDPNFDENVFGDDLELLSVVARKRITDSHNPLNAAHNAAADRACTAQNVDPNGSLLTRSSNWPPPQGAPNPPIYSSWIVGLYEGGVEHDCDVYHPTGLCLMNESQFNILGFKQSNWFCWVCRYAMVDLLDPTLHGMIDDQYEPHYPK